jgi:protease-4
MFVPFAAATLVALAGLPAMAQKGVAMIEIKGTPVDQPSPLAWLSGPDASSTLQDLADSIRDLSTNARVDACVIRLKDAQLGFTQIQELGSAMKDLRESGKKVHLFAEGYATPELILGSFADEVIVQSGGVVALSGLYMEELFLADALSWLGVKAELVQVGDYKGANEQMTRSAPSPQWDQNINQLLDGMYAVIRDTLKENRNLTDAQLDEAMAQLWIMDPEAQVASGLIDASVDLVTLEDHLETAYGQEIVWRDVSAKSTTKMDMSNPFAIFNMLSQTPSNKPTGPAIGVLHISGPIIDGDSSYGGLMGSASVGSRTIRNALEDIRNENQIKGIVVRIDSPGGSAIASEVIWQGLRRVSEKKPVWVSVGSMAASGGYYCLVGGQKVYVNPSSIVGSIGVVGGKYSMGNLYERLNVNVVPRARGPRAEMFSSVRPWDEATTQIVRQKMAETYDLFTSRVSAGRPGMDLGKTAEGRLFVGTDAIKLGMADRLGTLNDAVTDLAAELGMKDFEIINYPGPMGLDEFFEKAFGQFVTSPGGIRAGQGGALSETLALVREIVGPRAWPSISAGLDAMGQLREEPVLLTMPRALIFK